MRGHPGTTGPCGTVARYMAGCRCDRCRTGMRRYTKRHRLEGRARKVPSLGTRRRIEALSAIGWTHSRIAARLGVHKEAVRQWTDRDTILRSTAERVAALYDEICMVPPVASDHHGRSSIARAKARARRNGYAPPLAWDDIDDPDEKPRKSVLHKGGRHNADIDEWMFLVRGGEDPERASARLGVSVAAISRAAWRQGRADVLALSEPAALRVRYEKESA